MTTKYQSELQQEIIDKSGINIVTCGNCGRVMFHYIEDNDIKCPDCGFESEACDFPDFE